MLRRVQAGFVITWDAALSRRKRCFQVTAAFLTEAAYIDLRYWPPTSYNAPLIWPNEQ
jgi:hypothetical protein